MKKQRKWVSPHLSLGLRGLEQVASASAPTTTMHGRHHSDEGKNTSSGLLPRQPQARSSRGSGISAARSKKEKCCSLNLLTPRNTGKAERGEMECRHRRHSKVRGHAGIAGRSVIPTESQVQLRRCGRGRTTQTFFKPQVEPHA